MTYTKVRLTKHICIMHNDTVPAVREKKMPLNAAKKMPLNAASFGRFLSYP